MRGQNLATDKQNLFLQWLLFIACIPQAGSLLLKVYGVLSLQAAFQLLAIPGLLIIVGIYAWSHKTSNDTLRESLQLGFMAGLAGTIAYDLARVPFYILGQRIFAPISAYGVWLLDANSSNQYTELAGWGYHFLNGISFGVMYTLFMRGKPVYLAICWACLLETIAFLSPFGRIFGFTTNMYALGIAYFGHFVYGIPLGQMVLKDHATLTWMKSIPKGFYQFGAVLILAYCAGQLLLPGEGISSTAPGAFSITGNKLSPSWVRITDNKNAIVVNKNNETRVVTVKQLKKEFSINAGEEKTIVIENTGIYQLFVNQAGRTQSSFLIIDPVEKPAREK